MTTTTRTMKTSKATHLGHCQVCGCKQKLPKGILAKHGYTTRWGFFSGVCAGAEHLPFEQDASLIEGMIAAVTEQARQLRETAARERTESDPEDCWYHAYLGRDGYRWVRTRLFVDGFMQYIHPGNDRKPQPFADRVHAGLSYDLAKAANECNVSHADHLEREAARMDEYVGWQRSRIADWKPQPLTPVN